MHLQRAKRTFLVRGGMFKIVSYADSGIAFVLPGHPIIAPRDCSGACAALRSATMTPQALALTWIQGGEDATQDSIKKSKLKRGSSAEARSRMKITTSE